MSVPSIAGTGQFQGPYQFIHLSSGDTSSYVVGSSAGDIIKTSSTPISGVIVSVLQTQIAASATGGFVLTVDGTSSTIPLQSSNPFSWNLNIGFQNSFVISNNSSGGSAVVTYLTKQG